MAVLLFILRLIGWILLALLVILLAALVLPLGIRVSYHPGSLQVRAYYGPLQFTLWPRGGAGSAPAAPQPAAAPHRPQAHRQLQKERRRLLPQQANRAPRLLQRLPHRTHCLSRQLPRSPAALTQRRRSLKAHPRRAHCPSASRSISAQPGSFCPMTRWPSPAACWTTLAGLAGCVCARCV